MSSASSVGPEGAHRVHNASDDAARVALFSNKHEFGIIEYPDSDKIGVWGRHDESLDHVIRRSPDLDYWDGEEGEDDAIFVCGERPGGYRPGTGRRERSTAESCFYPSSVF